MAKESEGREALVRAAKVLLQVSQPSGIRGRALAQRAGVTYSLIAHHWGGVEPLLVEAFIEMRNAWIDQLTSDVETWIGGPGEWFIALARAYGDADFDRALDRHGWFDHRPRDLLASMLPALGRGEVRARLMLFLRCRSGYFALGVGVVMPWQMRNLLGDLTERELMRFERERETRYREIVTALLRP